MVNFVDAHYVLNSDVSPVPTVPSSPSNKLRAPVHMCEPCYTDWCTNLDILIQTSRETCNQKDLVSIRTFVR
jgi:hypothetical protein